MKIIYTPSEFATAKSTTGLQIECEHCHKIFLFEKRWIQAVLAGRGYRNKGKFCSASCFYLHSQTSVIVQCEQCESQFKKLPSQIKTTKHNFCCLSCAAKWRNTHKTKGTKISKLEVWLSKQLPTLYPNVEFHFNRKDTINGELDIYIPSMKLAFELNGICHYEPIYGADKLSGIQSNDCRKFQACIERGIELCTIDVSHVEYFKEKTSLQFLNIICKIINLKMVPAAGIEPA